MACCGQKRKTVNKVKQKREVAEAESKRLSQPQVEKDPRIFFQYSGKTALTITGPNSRKHYRFEHPGAVIEVDPMDRRAFSSVSVLTTVEKEATVSQ